MRIKLSPGASFNGFRGILPNAQGEMCLRAFVTDVAEKGKANQSLIKMLAKNLGLAKGALQIISGETDHWKKIYIETTQTNIIDKLSSLIKE